jgi:hypothetical protein
MKCALKLFVAVAIIITLAIVASKNVETITIDNPKPFDVVSSPLKISGAARGTWFFEASFPIQVLNSQNEVIGNAIAQAQDDWMTEDFVAFVAEVEFESTPADKGTLVFKKDNPSGLPENDSSFSMPVIFGETRESEQMREVKLYYYNQIKDTNKNGNAMCSKDGLDAVWRKIPITQTPIQDTIRLLLKGKLTQAELENGLSTEYPLHGFELKGATLENGELTLDFLDPENKTGGGSCRIGILWFQIEETAKQFSEVINVKFTPEELFQP